MEPSVSFYSGHSVADYRVRKFKRSTIGQICRGAFFTIYYPVLWLAETLRLSWYIARALAFFTAALVMWALGFRDNVAPHVLAAVGALPVAALTAAYV